MNTKKELREMCGWCGEIKGHVCPGCGVEQEKCNEDKEGHCENCVEIFERDLK